MPESDKLGCVVKESLGSGVELQQAAELITTTNDFAHGAQWYGGGGEEKKVAHTLVVPLKMMMIDVFVQRAA
jgi:hypothetical protein